MMPSNKKRISAFEMECMARNESPVMDAKLKKTEKTVACSNKFKVKKTNKKSKSKKIKQKSLAQANPMEGLVNNPQVIDISGESDSCAIVERDSDTPILQSIEVTDDETDTDSRLIEKDSGDCASLMKTKAKKSKTRKQRKQSRRMNLLQEPDKQVSTELPNKRKRKRTDDGHNSVVGSQKKSKIGNREKLQENDDASECGKTMGTLPNEIEKSNSYLDIELLTDETGDEATLCKSPVAIPLAGSVLVIASHPCVFPLKGRVSIQSVVGLASVMGYSLVPGRGSCEVYSPDCSSLITVSTVKGKTNTKKAVKKVDSCVAMNKGAVLSLLHSTLKDLKPFVILKFDTLATNLCSFISSIQQYSNIFKVVGDRSILNKQLLPLNVVVPKEADIPRVTVTDQLQAVIDTWMEMLSRQPLPHQQQAAPVMLVCGGKDSGKSTTNIFLVNSTLSRCDSVFYLECDIGQTQFTPPGVVSLVEVTSPVLGPAFTQQRKTLCSYHYGSTSPQDNPDVYIHCLCLCVRVYQQHRPCPLIINTMGWIKGLGWQLLLDTIRLVSPSIIVQLTAHQNWQNVAAITAETLTGTSWTDVSQMYDGPAIPKQVKPVAKTLHVDVPVSMRHNFKLKAADYCNLGILSHLGNDLEPGLTLTSVTPYTVSWKDVAIHMGHVEVSRSQVMYALNASLVALCEGDISKAETFMNNGPLFLRNKTPCKWIGYGIVRGIDMERRLFYVVTSLREEDLARVSIIDMSAISVPESYLISQKCADLLYVDEVVDSMGLSAVRPRKHMPRKSLTQFKA